MQALTAGNSATCQRMHLHGRGVDEARVDAAMEAVAEDEAMDEAMEAGARGRGRTDA